ncbi:hypothetical protein DSO57_1008980 [Entomophthora muscae]|uniref:Uncharacterized protein n=1 Tax=Entomophthora muscae TaxID=34485 RepID=A0ACC2SW36_9FUNG|nr:hypothetical protein DSO57_1008980 [Entomophthora muscae]
MHPVVCLLRYILYNLILSQIITGRWGPAVSTLLLPLPNVNLMPVNLGVFPAVSEAEILITSQCPEFYAKDSLILSQYLKLCWWLIINSMWILVVIPHHLETSSYYPTTSVTGKWTKGENKVELWKTPQT